MGWPAPHDITVERHHRKPEDLPPEEPAQHVRERRQPEDHEQILELEVQKRHALLGFLWTCVTKRHAPHDEEGGDHLVQQDRDRPEPGGPGGGPATERQRDRYLSSQRLRRFEAVVGIRRLQKVTGHVTDVLPAPDCWS